MPRDAPTSVADAGVSERGSAHPVQRGRRTLLSVAVFALALAFDIALDWTTFTMGFAPYGVAPWNPVIGLAVAVVLFGGRRFVALLFIAPMIDKLVVRSPVAPWQTSAIEALVAGAVYALAIAYLRRDRTSIERLSARNLAKVLGLLCGAALAVALGHVTMLAVNGELIDRHPVFAALHYWIGEVIGILVVVPFVLFVWLKRWVPVPSPEVGLQIAAILLAITIVFGLDGQTRLHFSYVLFLPVMWAALRFGLAGAATALLLTQNGIMLALYLTGDHPSHVPAFQALMAALALSGLAVGVLIEERNQIESRLLAQQAALGRAGRIGALGTVTTSIAHELNQPLTAGLNFNRLTVTALTAEPPDVAAALASGRHTLVQIERAVQIIRRLRDFIQVGHLEIANHDLPGLLRESLALAGLGTDGGSGGQEVVIEGRLPLVAVDSLQIEQVIINLLRNSLEAIEASGRERRIVIAARWPGKDFVEVSVRDNGCGFPEDFRLAEGAGLGSSKLDGLGIGLQLSQSIVRSHGGTFEITRSSPLGTVMTFSLPVAKGTTHV